MFSLFRFIGYAKKAEKLLKENSGKIEQAKALVEKIKELLPEIQEYVEIAKQFLDKFGK